MVKDPVCGMNVDEKKVTATAVYKGKTFISVRLLAKSGSRKNRKNMSRLKQEPVSVGDDESC